uniref:Uncharacterized protein n=1 Tax=Rhizophora mucronata TaxID=61149 RepID=A0A2P2NU72_RHIMU
MTRLLLDWPHGQLWLQFSIIRGKPRVLGCLKLDATSVFFIL